MHALKEIVTTLALCALFATFVSATAEAANVFSQSLANLSDADRESMTRARNEALAKMQQGAVSIWKDDKTGHTGEARVARVYERNGLMCAEVDHYLKLPRESHYVIPFCRDATGAWRAAF